MIGASRVVTCLVIGLAAVCCSTAPRVDRPLAAELGEPAPASRYQVDTGARIIVPRAGLERLAEIDEKVFLQFERPLSALERAELEAAEVVFYETFAPITYLASVPRGAAGALAEHPYFRGLEPMAPADKLRGGPYPDGVPAHARRPGGAVAALVRFYRDVPLAEALAVLDAAGLAVADRSRLLFGGHLEASGARERLIAVADSPRVRSVDEVPPPAEVDDEDR